MANKLSDFLKQLSQQSGAAPGTVANKAALPTSGNAVGDLKIVESLNSLYIWDGTKWERFFTGPDETLTWSTEPDAAYALSGDGTPTTINHPATDPEGFPIDYSYVATPSNQQQATISQDSSVTTVTPSTNSAHEGSFTLRTIASDGLYKISKNSTMTLSFSNAVWAQWADGTTIKEYAGTSLITNGTTSESHSTISRPGLRVDGAGNYIQFTGLPDFDFDPGAGENFIVWAMRFPTTLSLGYGMSIRDKNGTTINFIDGMQRFQSNTIHEMNMYTSNDGGNSFNNSRGNYPYADLTEYGHPGAGTNYMQDKYIIYAIDSTNASLIWCKEVGGNGLAFQLKPNWSGSGRTQFYSNANNMITFFGGAPHVYTIPGVSGGSGNHSIWKIDVAAVAVYPISFGGGDAVIADFASVIGA